MMDCCSLQNVASFQLLLECCSESLTFQCVTSSLQGPPNYTYAGLHSNQILTVKVCPSKWTLPSPFLSGGWTLFILADGKANLTSVKLSLLAFHFQRLLMSHLCFPTAVICLLLDSCLYFIRYIWISDLSPVCHVLLSITLLPSLSFNPLSFLAVFSCPVLATPFPSQMVFPRYNHGFLSGDQSNSFQRRYLKVDHNWGMRAR